MGGMALGSHASRPGGICGCDLGTSVVGPLNMPIKLLVDAGTLRQKLEANGHFFKLILKPTLGMSHGLRLGLRASTSKGVLIGVCDQPKRMNTRDLVRCFYEEIWNCDNKAKISERLHGRPYGNG
jgi:hypothetical protein